MREAAIAFLLAIVGAYAVVLALGWTLWVRDRQRQWENWE